MKQVNLLTKQEQIYRYRKQTVVTKGETWGGGINQKPGMNTHYYI